MGAIGDVYARLLRVIGLDLPTRNGNGAHELGSIEGIEFDAILRGWISERKLKTS